MSNINLGTIYDRVCGWNMKRYDREYNHELSCNLLREEHKEYFEAENNVQQLDALCDIVYVALGIVWKLNLEQSVVDYNSELAAQQVEKFVESNTLEPIYFLSAAVDSFEHDNEMPLALSIQLIITLAFTQMHCMGLTASEALYAMSIVCDSNDSKSINKTPTNVKANIDKGEFFVAPEPRLQTIINTIMERYNAQ